MAAIIFSLSRNYDENDNVSQNGYSNVALPDPVTAYGWQKDGSVFKEWNTARDGSGTSYQTGEMASTSLYAIWEKTDVIISYNGNTIATMSDSGTKTLETSGKYVPADILIRYTKSSASGNTSIFHGTCNTLGNTSTKSVSIDDPNFTIKEGTIIHIWFAHTNTVDTPSLQINNGEIYPIYFETDFEGEASWINNGWDLRVGGFGSHKIYYVFWDGGWCFLGWDHVDNTTSLGAVPTTRTVNGKALSGNITLTAADIDGIKGTLGSSDNLNDYRTSAQAGIYYCSQATNAPHDYGMLTVYSGGTGTLAYQTFVSSNNYFFTRYYGSGSWTEWYKGLSANNTFELGHVARTNSGNWGQSFSLGGTNYWDANYVTVNSSGLKLSEQLPSAIRLTTGTLSNGASTTLSIDNGERGMIFLCSYASNGKGIVGYGATSAGAVGMITLVGASGVTTSSATNQITLTNSTGAALTYIKLRAT